MAPMQPTPWGIDFAAPQGTVAEQLRKLTAIQENLRLEHNAGGAKLPLADFRKRQREFWSPRSHAVGDAICKLRDTLPVADGPMALRYDRGAERKTAGFVGVVEAVDLGETFRGVVQAAEPPDPYEDFSAPNYTEVDEDGDISIYTGDAANSGVYVADMRNDAVSHVSKSHGAGHFGDLEHLFESKSHPSAENTATIPYAVTNTVGTLQQWYDALSQCMCAFW